MLFDLLHSSVPFINGMSALMAFVAASYWLSSTEASAGPQGDPAYDLRRQMRLNAKGARWAGFAALTQVAAMVFATFHV